MKHQKLELSEDDFEFELIAFSTSLDDYMLAYHVNKVLKIYLKRSEDITIDSKNDTEEPAVYQKFEYKDPDIEVDWCLFKNHTIVKTTFINTLFDESVQKVYFIDEYRNADYILRIENHELSEEQIQQLITKLKQIDKVSTVFWIDQERIKNKGNLIF